MSLWQIYAGTQDTIPQKEIIYQVLKKILYFFLLLIALLVVGYLLGPRPDYPDMDYSIAPTKLRIDELEQYLAQKESTIKNLKPDNQSRIAWPDSTQTKTEYAIAVSYTHLTLPTKRIV